jgi:hypothetical protein
VSERGVNPVWGCDCPPNRHAEDCAGYTGTEQNGPVAEFSWLIVQVDPRSPRDAETILSTANKKCYGKSPQLSLINGWAWAQTDGHIPVQYGEWCTIAPDGRVLLCDLWDVMDFDPDHEVTWP